MSQRQLLLGLVGEKHRHLYTTSASFKSTVDSLVQMLPFWIDGLAEQCAKSDEQTREAMEMIKRAPLTEEFIKGLRDGLPWATDLDNKEMG